MRKERSYRHGLFVATLGRYCKLVSYGSRSVEAATARGLSEGNEHFLSKIRTSKAFFSIPDWLWQEFSEMLGRLRVSSVAPCASRKYFTVDKLDSTGIKEFSLVCLERDRLKVYPIVFQFSLSKGLPLASCFLWAPSPAGHVK